MKQINSLGIILAFIVVSACSSDLLDVDPKAAFVSENYYVSEEQVFNNLIGAYDPAGWSMAGGQWISHVMLGEIRSDNALAGGDPSNNDQPAWQDMDDLRVDDANLVLQPLYKRNYIGIARVNDLLTKVELEGDNINRYLAEARFLRAFYHFELFKNFGPVVIADEIIEPNDASRSRATMSEMFDLMESDLLAAIPLLPEIRPDSETGRATRGSAQALLGKILLYKADMMNDDAAIFDAAATQLQAVVDGGNYELVDDYQELFDFGVKNSSEAVFEIQHSNKFPSDWVWFEGIEGNGIVQLCGIRGLCSNHPDYVAGWGFMLPTSSLYDAYLADDEYRRDASIASIASLTEDIQDAGASCNTVVDLTQTNPTDYTGYWQIKYANYQGYEGNNVNGGTAVLTKDANTHYIRYADVLLMLAEALHRGTGSDNDAMMYIDMVRERAAGPGDNTGNFRTAADLMADEGYSSLLDVIYYERRIELALEGDRWYDLLRSGRLDASLFTGLGERANNFDENDLWLPVSLQETAVSKNVTTYPDPSLFN